MGYLIFLILVITIILAFLQDYLKQYRAILYCLLALILILTAGFREIGVDPDSTNYEYTYLNCYSDKALDNVEYSYIFLSQLLNFFTKDAHAIFLLYAILGVSTKFLALRKLSDLYFIPIIVYIGYYFTVHECMQIRTGVLSGLFLFVVKYLGDGDRKKALICLLAGLVFHYSALLILPFFLVKNKPIGKKGKIFWSAIIPAAYVIALMGVSFMLNTFEIPYIGSKVAAYQSAQEKGVIISSINIFSPRDLMSICIYYYLLIFYDTLATCNKYFPLMMKFFGVGLFVYVSMSFFPVLAQRTYMLLSTVTIVLISNIYYTIKQKWAGLLLVACISLLYLNYSLANIEFYLLWKV